jgi:hypothetical protein
LGSAAGVPTGALIAPPVNRSIAERTVSRVLRLRTAFSSGLATGERWIKA